MICKEMCEKNNTPCINGECRHWINYSEDLNCVLVCTEKHGRLTLDETSKRLGISLVRVKQIQDKAMKKVYKKVGEDYI
tara:strand:- start:351 stop:587 length:237 start_codon:yes stop_codon:yes gene_type:complete